MHRTCRSTATSKRSARRHRGLVGAVALCLLLVAAACSPVRPVVKIGVIAPFEGLYRQTGYAVLNATRRAIADCSPDHTAVLPLALDDSSQPQLAQRAAQELLADPAVVAIVGPFSLDTASAAAAAMTEGSPMWVVPIAVDASGDFASPHDGLDWLTDLVLEIAALARTQGADYLLVAGLPPTWLGPVTAGVSKMDTQSAIRFISPASYDFSQMEPGGSLLWLGQPHLGAPVASAVHDAQPDAAFWMGPAGEDPVFAAQSPTTGPLFWASWVTPQYNADSQQYAPDTRLEFLTYSATCHALAETFGPPETGVQPLFLRAFRVNRNGQSEPVADP